MQVVVAQTQPIDDGSSEDDRAPVPSPNRWRSFQQAAAWKARRMKGKQPQNPLEAAVDLTVDERFA